jgi:60 kDa SS-A/Ro ribonucleoprotein
MLYAMAHQRAYDGFMVLTDNETWYGQIHPMQALRAYRERIQPRAKLCVVGMTATDFSIADPSDAGCLDVAGFDTATPNVISEFMSA